VIEAPKAQSRMVLPYGEPQQSLS